MFKDKKVLLFGLGVLGGGVETAKFLLSRGAKLTITDSKKRPELISSIKQLPRSVTYKLGGHSEKDLQAADIIVFNQSVYSKSEWVKKAKKLKKIVLSDLSLFLTEIDHRAQAEYLAITGTRGKTTTATWIAYLLDTEPGGNIPNKGLLKIVNKNVSPYVLELSSFQLEYNQKKLLAPKVAVITNLYQDHLNRYQKMEVYAKEKAKIFLNQTSSDYLVLNADDKWTKFFLAEKPQAQVYYFSLKNLSKNKNGLCLENGKIIWQENQQKFIISRLSDNFNNSAKQYCFLRALLVSYLYKRDWNILLNKIESLPQVELRQEKIFDNGRLQVINDGAATSPEGTMALLENYLQAERRIILITGGMDKNLDFKEWAQVVKKTIRPENLFFLAGTGTDLMIEELQKNNYWPENITKNQLLSLPAQVFNNFDDIFANIKIFGKTTILFSASAASFNLFTNEFDRADKFVKAFKQSGLVE